MMPRHDRDIEWTCHGYRKDMDFTQIEASKTARCRNIAHFKFSGIIGLQKLQLMDNEYERL